MKKVLRITGLVIIGLIVIGTFVFLWNKSRPKITVYEIENPKRDSIANKTVATGNIEPRNEILIKPQISGIISEVLKDPGQMINSGDVIAVVKVVPEMGQLNSAESRVRIAQINMEQIKQEYQRQSVLFNNNVISQEEFETALSAFKKALEEVDNAKDALDIVKNGVSQKFIHLSNTQIRSTITGTILDVPVKVGNSVIQANTFNEGTTIASIADMGDMIFRGKVDETEVGRVKEGMPITLSIGALNNKKFNAILEYVSPKGINENGAILFEIKAAAKIPEGVYIRAGYSANAEIVLDKADDVITIPESSVEFINDSAYVYVLKEEKITQVFDKKYVKVGLSDGIKIEIKEGLTEKDRVRGNAIDPKAKKEEKKK